jgi:nicotinate-nucleotide pyrophosphorylase (carboxylating)
MVLIKDNHIVAAGGVAAAVRACCAYLERQGINVAVEVETKSLDEIREALSVPGVTRIMLDNFPIEEIHAAVQLIDHRVEVEASGGVTLESVRSIAETGVDLISVGALTHSAKALDISLELSQHV